MFLPLLRAVLPQAKTTELASIMYSLAIITFDSFFPAHTDNADTHAADPAQRRAKELATEIHRTVLTAYKAKRDWDAGDGEDAAAEFAARLGPYSLTYDQCAGYFELVRGVPALAAMARDILGDIPVTTGPGADVPSRMHAETAGAMMAALDAVFPGEFDASHEFNGLRGVYPVDTAVFHRDRLVALVEIDGEYHYKQGGKVLPTPPPCLRASVRPCLTLFLAPSLSLSLSHTHTLSLTHTLSPSTVPCACCMLHAGDAAQGRDEGVSVRLPLPRRALLPHPARVHRRVGLGRGRRRCRLVDRQGHQRRRGGGPGHGDHAAAGEGAGGQGPEARGPHGGAHPRRGPAGAAHQAQTTEAGVHARLARRSCCQEGRRRGLLPKL